jgi:hypothetical protein
VEVGIQSKRDITEKFHGKEVACLAAKISIKDNLPLHATCEAYDLIR